MDIVDMKHIALVKEAFESLHDTHREAMNKAIEEDAPEGWADYCKGYADGMRCAQEYMMILMKLKK